MKLIDRQYLATPFHGTHRMAAWLKSQGQRVNRKCVRRLLCVMGLKAIYRCPRTSKPAAGHKIYPYPLSSLKIARPNQAWAADISYIPMALGFPYMVTIIEWYSRYVLSWRLSDTLDASLLYRGSGGSFTEGQKPEISNAGRGAHFTSEAFTGLLEQHGVRISVDEKGIYSDNLFIERPWRSVKYEEVCLKAYRDGRDARPVLVNTSGSIMPSVPTRPLVTGHQQRYFAQPW